MVSQDRGYLETQSFGSGEGRTKVPLVVRLPFFLIISLACIIGQKVFSLESIIEHMLSLELLDCRA